MSTKKRSSIYDIALELNGEKVYKPYVAVSSSNKRDSTTNKSSSTQKQSPTIGMTDYEAVESTWGRPSKINKTETMYGVNEKWIYPNGYLYFEDHYLVSIQSSR